MKKYFHNEKLFARDYFNRVLEDSRFPSPRVLPDNWKEKLSALQLFWENDRKHHMAYDKKTKKDYTGLPQGWVPLQGNSESNIEQGFNRKVLEEVFDYTIDNNRTLELQGEAAKEVKNKSANQRPDMILFPSKEALALAAQHIDQKDKNAATFCKEALFVLDAKIFSIGVGADE